MRLRLPQKHLLYLTALVASVVSLVLVCVAAAGLLLTVSSLGLRVNLAYQHWLSLSTSLQDFLSEDHPLVETASLTARQLVEFEQEVENLDPSHYGPLGWIDPELGAQMQSLHGLLVFLSSKASSNATRIEVLATVLGGEGNPVPRLVAQPGFPTNPVELVVSEVVRDLNAARDQFLPEVQLLKAQTSQIADESAQQLLTRLTAFGFTFALFFLLSFVGVVWRLRSLLSELTQQSTHIRALNSSLEAKVHERTASLEVAMEDLRQAHLSIVQNEKTATLGRMAANLSHELNSPLAAIQSLSQSVLAAAAARFQADTGLVLTDFRLERLDRKARHELLDVLSKGGVEDEELAELLLSTHCETLATDTALLRKGEFALRVWHEASVILMATEKAVLPIAALREHADGPGQSHHAVFHPLKVHLATVTEKLGLAARPGVTFEVAVDDSLQVFGNPRELDQVWFELLKNAAQAVSAGWIRLVATEGPQEITVTVADSGPGVPPDSVDNLFKPFFTTRSRYEGQGLGLDYCRRVVEAHRGTIAYLGSDPTTFKVTLPRSGD